MRDSLTFDSEAVVSQSAVLSWPRVPVGGFRAWGEAKSVALGLPEVWGETAFDCWSVDGRGTVPYSVTACILFRPISGGEGGGPWGRRFSSSGFGMNSEGVSQLGCSSSPLWRLASSVPNTTPDTCCLTSSKLCYPPRGGKELV